jgi:hypothetical protein
VLLDGVEDGGPIRPMQLVPGPLERQEGSRGKRRFQRLRVRIWEHRTGGYADATFAYASAQLDRLIESIGHSCAVCGASLWAGAATP